MWKVQGFTVEDGRFRKISHEDGSVDKTLENGVSDPKRNFRLRLVEWTRKGAGRIIHLVAIDERVDSRGDVAQTRIC